MDFRTVISACQLTDNLDRDDLVILDCRFDLSDPAAGRQAWLEGHIPGALFADLDIDLSGPVAADTGRHPLPDVDVLTERLGRFGISTASQVVCYDQASGALAARAWWLLQWLGHERAAVLDGGFAGWLAGQGPVRVGEEACSAQTFRGQPADPWVRSTKSMR